MRAREYNLMCEAVERGITFGWNHAYDHVDEPSERSIKDQLHSDIMLAIEEAFVFDEWHVDESV